MRLTSRIEKLEADMPARSGIWHRIIQHLGMTRDDALDAYGRDKIGPDDNLIVRTIIKPEGIADATRH